MLLERRIVLSRFLKLSTPVLLTAPVAKCGESETRTWWHSTTHGQRTYRGWWSCGTMQNPCLLDVGPSFLDILGRRMAHVVKFQLLLVSFLSPSFFSAYPNPLRLESPTATHKPKGTLTCFFIQLYIKPGKGGSLQINVYIFIFFLTPQRKLKLLLGNYAGVCVSCVLVCAQLPVLSDACLMFYAMLF